MPIITDHIQCDVLKSLVSTVHDTNSIPKPKHKNSHKNNEHINLIKARMLQQIVHCYLCLCVISTWYVVPIPKI